MIKLLSGRADFIDRRLAAHFFAPNANGEKIPDEINELFDECEPQIIAAQSLTAAYSVYDITRLGGVGLAEQKDEKNEITPRICPDYRINLGFATVNSRDLYRSLEGCDKIILFAATAGFGIDRLIIKNSRVAPTAALAMQALGAALVERWCDGICEKFTEELGANRHRYSCGFGDLPLTLQRDIFTALDLEKTLKLSLSDACIMSPSKSVTAIVGIKTNN